MCIFTFLYYAKDLLTNSSTVKFVPYLHNNSSTLESQNSVIRTSNRDTAQGLEKAIITSNQSSGMKLTQIISYSKDDSTEENKIYIHLIMI